MPIKVGRYLPPGSYITEEIVKPIPAFIGLPRQICLIGEGDPCKTYVNERHSRAYIDLEEVTVDENGTFVLKHKTDEAVSTMFLFRNGDQLDSDSFTIEELVPDAPVAAISLTAGSLTAGNYKWKITFLVGTDESGASAASNVAVSLGTDSADVAIPLGPSGTTTRKLYRTASGGSTYKFVATIANNTATTIHDGASDASIAGGAAPPVSSALTVVSIEPDAFDSSADYTFSYQGLTSELDEDVLFGTLGVTPVVDDKCGTILSVGSFPGTTNYVKGEDYELDVVNSSIRWLPAVEAEITGNKVEPFNLLADKTLKITFNGGAETTIVITGLGATATAADVVTFLTTPLAGLATVTDSSGQVKIKTVEKGIDASITIGKGTADAVLGFASGALAVGSGKNPAQGKEYFVTYKGVRPDAEFNRPILSTSFDQFIAQVGRVSMKNSLALAGQIVFEQKPPFVYSIQVKKSDPTTAAAKDIDYTDAIKGAELNPDLTDIVILGHPTIFAGGVKPLVRAALRDHVIDQSSLQNKAEREGWFGMRVGTGVGDGETPGTFVFVATQELQVAADSPGRGRFVLCAPSFCKKTYRFPDGSVKQVTLDSTYLAAGCAGLMASFLSPSEGMLRKEVVGFDEVEELAIPDRNFLASQGVNVINSRAGLNVVFDPTSTDQSSAEFKELNVMAQKDNIVKQVRFATDQALIGVVPDDLAQFVFELKTVVAGQLNSAIADGTIAAFQNDNGTRRDIDLANDIIVRRRQSDPTSYDFRFSFFVKFIVKRLFGTFNVVIPSGV